MYFTHLPFIYLAMAAILLVVLYFWQRRSSRLVVPALFLWEIRDMPPQAGHRWKLSRLPLPFYLELLVILFLALAATSPFFLRESEAPALCVILDDSASMLATHNGSTVKEQQMKTIQKALSRSGECFWVVAGSTPRQIPSLPGKKIPMEQWTCQSREADIQEAIALARSIAKNINILVATDHQPEFAPPDDVHWSAKGQPQPNVAIVNARRGNDKTLLEVFNANTQPVHVSILANGKPAQTLSLAPNATTKVELPTDRDGAVQFTLEAQEDALELDNSVTLLPSRRSPLSYRLHDELPSSASALLRSTLGYSKEYIGVGTRELLIGTENAPKGPYNRLLWHSSREKTPVVSTLPITVNEHHESLTRGLDWSDLQWRFFQELELPGEGVAFQDNTKLLSLQKNGDYYDLHLNLSYEPGNLPNLPFWPSLFWNISDFLRLQRPGPNKTNLRTEEQLIVQVPSKQTATLDGTPLHVVNGKALCALPSIGLHTIAIGGEQWQVAANLLSQSESDLGNAKTLDLRPKQPPELKLATTQNSLSPLLFFLVIAILAVHWLVVLRPTGGRTPPVGRNTHTQKP